MLLLLQAGPLLLWRARPLSRPAVGILVAVGVTCISVAVFRLPATPRLYLPTLALAIPLVVAVSWESLGRPRNAATFAFVNLAITAAVFLRG